MFEDIESEALTSCQGTVFKASVQHYQTKKGGFGFQVRLVPVKKLSCPGCKSCGWEADNFGEVGNDFPIAGIEDCEDGQLYSITTCNESQDWETGMIDSWELCLLKHEHKILK